MILVCFLLQLCSSGSYRNYQIGSKAMTKRLATHKHLSRPVPPAASAMVARELLRKVKEFAGDPQRIVARAGLRQSVTILLKNGGEGTLTHVEFARLYAECTWELDACASRQDGRKPLTKSGFDLLCYCVITCGTLREVIDRTAAFSDLLEPRCGHIKLSVTGDVAVLHMASQRKIRNACAYLSDLTGLSSFHRLFGWLICEDIELLGVDMAYPRLLNEHTVARLMPHPINHRARDNSFRFSAGYLDRPVVREPAELEPLLRHFPFDLEEPQSKDSPLSERISHLLDTDLASGVPLPTAARLARQFSISLATLKRRLGEEGTALSELKTGRRRELAQRLLTDRRLAISEVARRSQYSDAGAFSRAFHQWTGHSPDRWRSLHCKPARIT
jgi:AraC-like DNA-binding protein